MSFLRRKKKAPAKGTSEQALNPSKEPPPLHHTQENSPASMEVVSTDSEPSSVMVEKPSSIFGGMMLSSGVAKREGQDSPYLSRGSAETRVEKRDDESAFGFIASGQVTVESVPVVAPAAADDDDDDDGKKEEDGEEDRKEEKKSGEEEVEKSAFGFISSEPEKSSVKESSFSFLNQTSTTKSEPAGGRKENGQATDEVDSSSTVRDDLLSQTSTTTRETKTGIISPQRVGVSSPLPLLSGETDLPRYMTSSGGVSPVPGPISPPLMTHTPPPPAAAASEAGGGGGGGGGRVSVGKQQPVSGKKKKKRKVLRPGHEGEGESVSMLVEPTMEEDHRASEDALRNDRTSRGVVGDGHRHLELDSVSLASQTSSTDTATSSVLIPSSSSTIETSSAPDTTVTEPAVVNKETRKEITEELRGREEEEEKEAGGVGKEKIDDNVLVDTSTTSDQVSSGTSHTQSVVSEKDERSEDQKLLAEVFIRTEPSDVAKKEEEEEEEKDVMKKEDEGGGGENKTARNYEVELTSSDQLTVLIQSSESNLARIRLELADVHKRKLSELDKLVSAAKQQRQNRRKMKELREREAKALSEEDYELAEELQSQIESVSQDSSWTISSTSHPLLKEWVQEVSELMKSEEALQSDIRTHLANMRDQQTQALNSSEEKIAASQTKQKMKLKALEDKLDRERGHIALDREHLEKREQLLQEEIASRAEKFIRKKTSLQEELQTVHSDIAELEKKLAELKHEETRLVASITEEEVKIQAVHHELDSENSSLHEERETVLKREQQLLHQQEDVEEVRKEYEVAQQEERAQIDSISGVLGRIEMRWEESERRTHTLVQSLSRASDLNKMESTSLLSPSPQLLKHREEVQGQEEEVKKVAGELETLQGTLSQLRRQITKAEERLPQLEETKKASVAARQYKEASRLSNEQKQLKTELEPQKKQVAEKEGEMVNLNKKLASLSGGMAEGRSQLDQLEREEDVEHLRQLSASLSRLHATKTSIPGVSAPLEKVLDSWLQIYQLLAEGLCAKHDLELSEYATHTEMVLDDREDGREHMTPQTSGIADRSTSAITETPNEERTPGVGREEEKEKVEGEEAEGEEDRAELEEVKKNIQQLEARIEEAVQEEVEDYELAAELDKELTELRTRLTSLVSN